MYSFAHSGFLKGKCFLSFWLELYLTFSVPGFLKGSGPLSANLFVSVLSESISDDFLFK